jgi:hypothetical protein
MARAISTLVGSNSIMGRQLCRLVVDLIPRIARGIIRDGLDTEHRAGLKSIINLAVE